MSLVKKCCNPFNKKNHKKVIKNLLLITKNRAHDFKDFIGNYMCNSCERTIYSGRKPEILGELSVNKCPEVNKPEKSNDVIEDDEEKDPTFHCKPEDNKLKIDKVNKFLTEIGEPSIKIKRVSSNKEFQNILTNVVSKFTM